MEITSTSLHALTRRWIRRLLAIVLSVATLGGVYFGYCWGWWLRDNLLAQALFQCNCPDASEAVRYAPFRLVASACSDAWVHISPSGTHLLITERATRPPVTVLVDAVTASRTVLPDATISTIFVTDTLLINLSHPDTTMLVDLSDPTAQPRRMERYVSWRLATTQHSAPGTLYLLPDAKQVVFVPIDHNMPGFEFSDVVDVRYIAQDPWAVSPERTIVMSSAYGRSTATRAAWDVDGRGVVDRTTRTVLVATGREARGWPLRPWMEPLPFQPIGWLAGDRSVIYQYVPERAFVIDFGSGAPFFSRLGLIDVPQPILALDVPEELLRATPP